jgi:hypothetical protein
VWRVLEIDGTGDSDGIAVGRQNTNVAGAVVWLLGDVCSVMRGVLERLVVEDAASYAFSVGRTGQVR